MKPRVFRRHGAWVCEGGGFGHFQSFVGVGETMALAYAGWAMIRQANLGNNRVGVMHTKPAMAPKLANMDELTLRPLTGDFDALDSPLCSYVTPGADYLRSYPLPEARIWL